MSKTDAPTAAAPPSLRPHPPRKAIPISHVEGDTPDRAGERLGAELLAPALAAFRVISAAEGKSTLGNLIDVPGMIAALRDQGQAVSAGDMRGLEAMLMGQATALQTLFTRLIERGVAQDSLPQYEAHMRLALKAQAQSRATLETLANIRNGPVIFARQANVAAGAPMQVNNGLSERARARQTEKAPNQLLEPPGHDMDAGAPARAVEGDLPVETLDALDRANER